MKRKIISLAIIFIIVLIALTGCESKKAISVEEFDKVLNAKEYTVEENKEYYDTYIDILDGRKAKNSDKWEIDFYVLSGDKDAELMFEKDKNMLEVYKKGSAEIEIETTMPSYSMYQIVANERFGYVCKVGNTVLFVDTFETNKDEIKAIIEELGY